MEGLPSLLEATKRSLALGFGMFLVALASGCTNPASNAGPTHGGPPDPQNWTFVLTDTMGDDRGNITIYSRTNMGSPAKRGTDTCWYTGVSGNLDSSIATRIYVKPTGGYVTGFYT